MVFAVPLARKSYLGYFVWSRVMGHAASLDRDRTQWEMSGRFFALPPRWTREQQDRWNKARYQGYILQIGALASALKIRYAHFLQPMPLIDKTLTEEERKPAQFVSRSEYERVFIPAIEELRARGLPVVSLTDVFRGHAETIYSDHIHCRYDGGDNPGYALLSERMATELGRLWRLKPKRELARR
jgi:hypothetical protein